MSNCENPGLYIHIPFCRTKCPYCDFYSITSLSLVPDWRDALMREIMGYKDQFSAFDSLYLGGGTPSVLSEQDLTRLFENIFRHFSFTPGTEITIEANPDDITREKLELLKALGVTRISLGVQSFDTLELRYLGRRHTARLADQALESIRRCGSFDLGVDLMYGLPGQQTSDWMKSMTRALDFRPEHLSCYQLTLHEETLFGKRLVKGRIKPLDEKEERDFFLLTAKFLEEKSYIHYEISNFARQEAYMARHNRKYWHRASYLGLGPSAHSFTDSVRWWNVNCVTTYCEMLGANTLPVAGSERLSEDQERLESLWLGLRTREGIDLSLVRHQSGADKVLAQLQAANLVVISGGRVIPTREGFVVADSLPLLFSDGELK
ncbi:MAG: radical SAM family heme chaperone HemW [Desulfatiglandales bacterium]|nr:radical SAM family heme chaperone HemW [Desulfatiglandales bacterium]